MKHKILPRSPSMTCFLWTKSLITISISSINWLNFNSLLPFSMYFSRQRFMFPRFCPISSGIPLPNSTEVISIVLCISGLIIRRIKRGVSRWFWVVSAMPTLFTFIGKIWHAFVNMLFVFVIYLTFSRVHVLSSN